MTTVDRDAIRAELIETFIAHVNESLAAGELTLRAAGLAIVAFPQSEALAQALEVCVAHASMTDHNIH